MALGGKREGAGRKKGYAALGAEKLREFIAQRLATEFGPIVDKAIEQAKMGDRGARDWLMDRAYGRPRPMPEEILNPEPITVKIINYADLGKKES